MTWKEFKEFVESKGVTDDYEVGNVGESRAERVVIDIDDDYYDGKRVSFG